LHNKDKEETFVIIYYTFFIVIAFTAKSGNIYTGAVTIYGLPCFCFLSSFNLDKYPVSPMVSSEAYPSIVLFLIDMGSLTVLKENN